MPIEGELVCQDFEVGAARSKMQGGMQFPVRLTFTRPKTVGTQVQFHTILVGRRSEQDAIAQSLLPDANETYTVEWAQCSNERATQPVIAVPKGVKLKGASGGATAYECGEATVYKTEQLVTKKGDKASHKIAFAVPPRSTCWSAEVPGSAAGAAATPAPSSSAAPVPAPSGSAPSP